MQYSPEYEEIKTFLTAVWVNQNTSPFYEEQ